MPSQQEIALQVPCSEQVVSRWNHDKQFTDAVNEIIFSSNHTLGLRATTASLGRAIRGSIKDYELYLQRTGQLPHLLLRAGVAPASASQAAAGAQSSATMNLIFPGVPPPPTPPAIDIPNDPTKATTIVPAPPATGGSR